MDKIIVLDFGSQYNQLIARRIREFGVYSELHSGDMKLSDITAMGDVKGIVFSGGPNSVYDPNAPKCDPAIYTSGIPILGICYGHQLLAYMAKGTIESAKDQSEYGKTLLKVKEGTIFKSVPKQSIVC